MTAEVKVAYQGMPGAYSEKATRQLLGTAASVVAVGYPSFEEAFQAVTSGDADFGVLPIQNSLGGSIHANYDLLLKYDLHIVGEYDLRVQHSLLALPGVAKTDIKTVISHPQALAQCAYKIERMGAVPRAEYDTAGSAKILADNQWKDTAAIASDLAAEYYGLQVLERGFEDDDTNFTRFLLLSRKEEIGLDVKKDTEFKTSLVFTFQDSNEKGQLYKALSAFALRDIDLSKIESRPWGPSAAHQYGETVESFDFSIGDGNVDRRKYKYLFYADIIGHQTDENIVNALRHLREFCKFVRVLGSYPTKGKLIGDVRKTLEAVGAYQAVPASPAITPLDKNPQPRRLAVGIYGFGNFGQFLAKTIAKSHEVRATSRTDYSALATELGCSYFSSATQLDAFFDGLDVLLICVSILSFESVLSKIPKHLLEKIVIVDVLSVKTHPKQVLLKNLPESASILCTHPMFGPESGKYTWRGLPMMFEKVRVLSGDHDAVMDGFLRIFESEQCRMLEMTCESHDEYAASSQFLTHLTGRILNVQGVKSTPIDTRGFKNLVRLVEDTCKDSFDLFQGLYEFNPNSEQQIQKFQDSLREVAQLLTQTTNKTSAPLTNGTHSAKKIVAADAPMEVKFPLNPLLNKVKASKTTVIHGMTKQLEAEGKQVWSLCVGEPDFPPEARVLNAGVETLQNGNVKYTDVKGTLELRKLIAQYLETSKGVKYDPVTEILVSNGAKQSVYQALLAICQKGDQVLIPSPFWVSYPDMAKLVEAEPLILPTRLEDNYLIDPAQLEKTLAANPKVKIMILCNPSNPSGTVHLPEHLERIAAVLRKPEFRHVIVIADEIYEQLIYQDEGEETRVHKSFASLPDMYERTLTVNGFSKSFAMPGLRIGYLAAPKYFTQVCAKIQGQLTSCANSVGQAAASEAMRFELECVEQETARMTETLAVMDAKRQFILKRLREVPQLGFAHPTSAFYVFMDLSAYFEGKQGVSPDDGTVVKDADDFCVYLLSKFSVALVPGSAFGVPNGLRISYASSMETLEHAMDGLEQSLASLKFESVPSAKVNGFSSNGHASNGHASNGVGPHPIVAADAPMEVKFPLNPLLNKVKASKTTVIHGMTKQLEAEGKQVWSLCVGEPDFPPEARVLNAGVETLQNGNVKYTDVKGTLELRKLIAQYLETSKGVKYDPVTEILVSNGAKQSVYQALLAICQKGDQVLIPSPFWVSYPDMAKLVEAEPLILPTRLEDNYLIDPAQLEKTLAANPKVKIMILCNPSNPSGTVHLPEHLERIAAVLRKPEFRHVIVIADEIYEQLIYQDEGEETRVHKSFASLPDMYERTLTVNGFSKSFAMPGLRIGYLAAPKYFTQVCAKIQGQLTSCANSVGQAAASEAMRFELECVEQETARMTETLAVMDAKRQFILKRLREVPQLGFAHPTSAFYVFMDLSAYFEGKQGVSPDDGTVVKDADDFCVYLLSKFSVALVPGSAFGVPNGLRISYASSMETLEHAMDGLEQSLASLKFESVPSAKVNGFSSNGHASNGHASNGVGPHPIVAADAPMEVKFPLNPLLNKVKASKTTVIHGMTKQLEAEGKQVWSLCVGEPDFPPEARVLNAGVETLQNGNVKYTDVKGTLELRKLIAQYLETSKGVKYDPVTEILVSNGAKQSVYQALLAICQKGDQVLIPSPFWVSYPDMAKLVEAEPLILPTRLEDNYLIDPAQLEKTLAANPKVKIMILCNPSNPSGTVHLPEHLERIAAVLRKPEFRHVIVIADEIYEQLIYQDEGEETRVHKSFASLPDMYERTLTVNGFSKSFAMPGLRIGYLAAPKYFTQVCAKIQGQLTSCANSVGQAAASEAMRFELECVEQETARMTETLAVMDAKRQFILKRLREVPQLGFAHPTSAFYVFMDLSAYFEGKQGVSPDDGTVVKDADDFCVYLLSKFSVALVPGSAFGVPNGLRISYASSMETLEHAMDGLEQSLASLKFESVPSAKVNGFSSNGHASNGHASNGVGPHPIVAADAPMEVKFPLNPLLNKVKASKTTVIHGMTKQLEAEGKQVWSLCVGEPDFPPEARVLNAGVETLQNGNVKYTDVKGTLELRKLIAQYLETSKGVKYDPVTEILVSNGAKQSVYQALLAICQKGDQVLIPSPFWVSYPDMAKLVEAEPLILPTRLEDNYLIDPAQLEKTLAANPKVKIMILCNPSNPSGTVHLPEHLERIAAVLRKPEFRHVIVIADEIYEQLIYQDEGEETRVHKSFASLPDMYERTLTVNGFSKSFAMPGLRIGYLAAPKYFTQVCAKIQGQLTSCANSVGQAAASEAMRFELECVEQETARMTETLAVMDAKRQFILKRLREVPQLGFAHPTSAFYVFMDLSAYFEGKQGVSPDDGTVVKDADDFCVYLLSKFSVALVPGSAFGVPNGLRISYASSMETLEHAMDGLEQSLASLKFESV